MGFVVLARSTKKDNALLLRQALAQIYRCCHANNNRPYNKTRIGSKNEREDGWIQTYIPTVVRCGFSAAGGYTLLACIGSRVD